MSKNRTNVSREYLAELQAQLEQTIKDSAETGTKLFIANREIAALRTERNTLQKICAERSDTIDKLQAQNERLKARGIEDMQHEITKLQAEVEEWKEAGDGCKTVSVPDWLELLKQNRKLQAVVDANKFEADRLKVFVDEVMPQLTGKDQRRARELLEYVQ